MMTKKLLFFSILVNIFLLAGIWYLINSLGGINYMLFKMKNRGETGVYVHRKDMFAKFPTKENPIVFLGNSITAQCEWSELFDNNNILNRGISGDNTFGIIERLNSITKLQPSKVFLMIGVNDLISYTPKQITANYRRILTLLKQQCPNTNVYIQSVLPVNNEIRNTGVENEDILDINKNLMLLAREFQLNYIDLHPVLGDEKGNLAPSFTKDGIHLNGDAYFVWKNAIEHLVE